MHKRRLWLDPLVHEYLSEPGGCDQPRVSGPITSWHCGEEIAGVEGCRQRERERQRDLLPRPTKMVAVGQGEKEEHFRLFLLPERLRLWWMITKAQA